MRDFGLGRFRLAKERGLQGVWSGLGRMRPDLRIQRLNTLDFFDGHPAFRLSCHAVGHHALHWAEFDGVAGMDGLGDVADLTVLCAVTSEILRGGEDFFEPEDRVARPPDVGRKRGAEAVIIVRPDRRQTAILPAAFTRPQMAISDPCLKTTHTKIPNKSHSPITRTTSAETGKAYKP